MGLFSFGARGGAGGQKPTQSAEWLERSLESARELADLRAKIERLYLINEALWKLVKEKLALTDLDLARLIEELDLEDGALNDRGAPKPTNCKHCGKVISVSNGVCPYCGTQHARSIF